MGVFFNHTITLVGNEQKLFKDKKKALANNQNLRKILNSVSIGILILDHEFNNLFVN